jgi:hypothetical protein
MRRSRVVASHEVLTAVMMFSLISNFLWLGFMTSLILRMILTANLVRPAVEDGVHVICSDFCVKIKKY